MIDIMELSTTCERRIVGTGSRCKRSPDHVGLCHSVPDDTHEVRLDLSVTDLAALDAFLRSVHELARAFPGVTLTGVLSVGR